MNEAVDKRRIGLVLGALIVPFVLLRVGLYIDPNGDFNVGGYNIHHLYIGLLLITLGGLPLALFRGVSRWLDLAAVVFGVGLPGARRVGLSPGHRREQCLLPAAGLVLGRPRDDRAGLWLRGGVGDRSAGPHEAEKSPRMSVLVFGLKEPEHTNTLTPKHPLGP